MQRQRAEDLPKPYVTEGGVVDSYRDETYGDRVASVYDEWYGGYEADSIEILKNLSRGGRALELGIRTGRVALPLARSCAADQ